MIVVETTNVNAPRYDAWFDCAVAEVSRLPAVERARAAYDVARQKERSFLGSAVADLQPQARKSGDHS